MDWADIEQISIIRLYVLMNFSVLYLLFMLNLSIHLYGTDCNTLLPKRYRLLANCVRELKLDHSGDWETLG
jgi:hypothetical protein